MDQDHDKNRTLRSLPSVNEILDALAASGASSGIPRELVKESARDCLNRWRRRLTGDGARATSPTAESIGRETIEAARRRSRIEMRRVINATGVILHSGIGRAVLPKVALEAAAAQSGYCLLAVRDEDGEREERDIYIIDVLKQLTGAEDGTVVNNNAAATMIILNTLASGREVICSHGHLVEIGGQFRIPEVMEMSGCRLRAVGTTNKTYVKDYERAIGPETGALLMVHTSNYRIVGFHEEPTLADLVDLGRRAGLPVVHDLGSGSLLTREDLGSGDEPPVQESLRAGADLVCFSGDKLIGGPQAGIILGSRAIVERIRKNPLARALRIDKLTCVALEATLKLYLDPDTVKEQVPTLRMLRESEDSLRTRASKLAADIHARLPGVDVREEPSASYLGSGALPIVDLPTTCVVLSRLQPSAGAIAKRLRLREVSIFTRVKSDSIYIDPRTLQPGEDAELVSAIAESLNPTETR